MAILVVDTGSSSMRTVVFAENGDVLFLAQQEYSMDLGPDGRATMQAEVFEQTLESLLKQTAAYLLKEKNVSLRGIALTSQRSSVLAVDRAGRPLYPILMWYDKRSAPLCGAINEQMGQEIYARILDSEHLPRMGKLAE